MKTLILSSSLSKKSKSFILCREVEKRLKKEGVKIRFIDAREMKLNPVHRKVTDNMEKIARDVKWADNIIIGMAVYNFSVNDSLKMILDTCFEGAENKFFGVVCAAGGEKSFLASSHLTQMCHNEYSMIQLPRIVYVSGKDFENGELVNDNVFERLDQFANDFVKIGRKLL